MFLKHAGWARPFALEVVETVTASDAASGAVGCTTPAQNSIPQSFILDYNALFTLFIPLIPGPRL
jgi:hypothetical protein